jgi:hypothetical protein
MTQFTKAGRITRDRHALRVDLDGGYPLGRLVIAAGNVSNLLNGHAVEVNFVQDRPGREVYIGYAGTARLSRSGAAVNIRLESRFMTVPRKALEAVVEGKRKSARLSSPTPIIDADRVQREAIDAGLPGSF